MDDDYIQIPQQVWHSLFPSQSMLTLLAAAGCARDVERILDASTDVNGARRRVQEVERELARVWWQVEQPKQGVDVQEAKNRYKNLELLRAQALLLRENMICERIRRIVPQPPKVRRKDLPDGYEQLIAQKTGTDSVPPGAADNSPPAAPDSGLGVAGDAPARSKAPIQARAVPVQPGGRPPLRCRHPPFYGQFAEGL